MSPKRTRESQTCGNLVTLVPVQSVFHFSVSPQLSLLPLSPDPTLYSLTLLLSVLGQDLHGAVSFPTTVRHKPTRLNKLREKQILHFTFMSIF